MIDLNDDPPALVRAVRCRVDWNQTGLGDRFGVSQETVSRWERGLQPVPDYVLYELRLLAEGWNFAQPHGGYLQHRNALPGQLHRNPLPRTHPS